ncbi:MAG TPA: L-aspartate oxidase [Lacisediminihabitans sp.]|uniref:L-aspartate oxidase n=1 Tax=Lacisediminihabitans sp. TaxID=2787631 RepID=UPI002EDB7D0D
MGSVIVVGTGIAGLVAALRAGREHSVTLITKAELAESNTKYAQGGIAVAMFPDDSVDAHIEDTMRVGAGLNVRRAVEVLCTEGPERVRDLIRLGVAFDRERGELARGREAAHSSARVLHAGGDATGAVIEAALVAAVRESATRVLEDTFVGDLVVSGGRVVGVDVLDAAGVPERIEADAVILASGGAGQLYRHTTNPAVTTGDGAAAAFRAGAVLEDVEFYQFHPTSLAVPGNFLISEAVRGEGAVLLDAAGRRFMTDWHPDGELAPRDVVARGIARQMAAQGGAPVLLDATALGGSFLAERFPGITRACLDNGLDWGSEPIPVTPAAHYWMGGVKTDEWGRTSLPGLFAVGEVACTGVHGANRLASNSLLESLVFAWRSVDRLDRAWPAGAPVSRGPREAGDPGASPGSGPFEKGELQELMWDEVGVFRSGEGLRAAADRLSGWGPASGATGTELLAEREKANLLELARLITEAAVVREESRGAHYRSDFPETRASFARHLDWTSLEPAREVAA